MHSTRPQTSQDTPRRPNNARSQSGLSTDDDPERTPRVERGSQSRQRGTERRHSELSPTRVTVSHVHPSGMYI